MTTLPNTGQCVLQDWVMKLQLREQGTLLTGIRGCDLTPKVWHDGSFAKNGTPHVESSERQLVAFLRFCVLNPADPREVGVPGSFFQDRPPQNWKPSEFGHYPLHWFTHMMHCWEVVAYRHPDKAISFIASGIYAKMVRSLHLNVETKDQMELRLGEDRIASGQVVS